MNFPTLTLKPANPFNGEIQFPKCDTSRCADCQHYTTFPETGYKCHYDADGYCLVVALKTLTVTEKVCEASKAGLHTNLDGLLNLVHIEP